MGFVLASTASTVAQSLEGTYWKAIELAGKATPAQDATLLTPDGRSPLPLTDGRRRNLRVRTDHRVQALTTGRTK